MKEQCVSIFVDESGNLSSMKDSSRFFLLCMLFHDQSESIEPLVKKFDSDLDRIGFTNLCFHAGPIIRHEDGYEYMNWELRYRIFSMMMAFARKASFRYRCICIDKKFVASEEQFITLIKTGITETVETVVLPRWHNLVKVYYDCGQAPVTNALQESMLSSLGDRCSFVPGVKPIKYKLFQVADLICTTTLIEKRLASGQHLTKSEDKFFGGPRLFKRNILKYIKRKEI